MTRDEIRALVVEEVARTDIAEEMDQRGPLSRFFAHPFVLTVAGFLFTFLISTWIESALADRQAIKDTRDQDLARIESEADTLRDSVIAIDEQARDRVVAGDMLRSGLSRQAVEEILPRKRTYDATFAQWNEDLRGNIIVLRSISEASSVFADAIEQHVQKVFPRIDGCLTALYDESRGRETPTWRCPRNPESGRVDFSALRQHSTSIMDCLDAIRRAALSEIDAREAAEQAEVNRVARIQLNRSSLAFFLGVPEAQVQAGAGSEDLPAQLKTGCTRLQVPA